MYRRNKNIMEYYSEIFELIKRQILGEKDEYIIATPTEDLVSFYISKNGLNPIEFDNEKEESIEHKKYIKRIPAEKRDWGYRDEGEIEIEAEKLIVKLPVLPNKNLQTILQLNTQTISLSSSNSIASSGNYLIFELEIKGYGRDLNEDKIVSLINAERARIQGIIESKKNEINTENESLQKNVSLGRFLNEALAKTLNGYEKILGMNIKFRYIVGAKITWADLAIINSWEWLDENFKQLINHYPLVKLHYDFIRNIKEVSEWFNKQKPLRVNKKV
jgi:hypothetical protein